MESDKVVALDMGGNVVEGDMNNPMSNPMSNTMTSNMNTAMSMSLLNINMNNTC